MKKRARVLQFGLGAMGSRMAEWVLNKKNLELVGAVVRSEEKFGRDISEAAGWKKKTGVKCYSAEEAYKLKPDVMLHAAVSYVPEVWKQIKPAVESGINVITIAEEMGYPFVKYPRLCREIDNTAKKNNARILGSGINPGFMMDYLVLALSGILPDVNKIKVTRVVNFAPFGQAIQNNIGIGMKTDEFYDGVKNGKLPVHIGLPECIYMVAHAMGWKINNIIKETKKPVIADRNIKVPGYKSVTKGRVCGFDQVGVGYSNGKAKIILEELGRVDPKADYKHTVYLYGKHTNLINTMNVPSGDLTTTAHAVNLIPAVLSCEPGLLTMLDLKVAPCLKDIFD